MRLRPLLLVVALLGAAGCAESDLTISVDPPGGRPSVPAGSTDADEVVATALEDIEAFWAEAMPDVYDRTFEPLRGGYVPYGPRTPLPRCGPEPLSYGQIAENALYCPAEDLIAWDRETLIPDLDQRFGPLTVGIVMAHEFAHAVQARADVEGPTVLLELQADCFAGAWVAGAGDHDVFATGGDALDQAVAGLLELRDTVGVAGFDPMAHGSGFDRVGAFQDGFEGSAEVCAGYEQQPPDVVAMPFTSLDDQVSGGNLPVAELLDPLLADLEAFFSTLAEAEDVDWQPVQDVVPFDPGDGPIRCGDEEVSGDELVDAAFHCASDDTHYVDARGLLPDLEEIGDFAVGGELARLHAFALQAQLGVDAGDDGAGLHADCLAGAFAGAEFREGIPRVPDRDEEGGVREQQLRLSPGDLDEVVIAFLAFGDEGDAGAFERTAAFRGGFVDGPGACERHLG